MTKKDEGAALEPEGDSPSVYERPLDAKIQEALGRSLRAHYDDIVRAPIPDKFLVLLAELEAKESRDGG